MSKLVRDENLCRFSWGIQRNIIYDESVGRSRSIIYSFYLHEHLQIPETSPLAFSPWTWISLMDGQTFGIVLNSMLKRPVSYIGLVDLAKNQDMYFPSDGVANVPRLSLQQ